MAENRMGIERKRTVSIEQKRPHSCVLLKKE
jgi:hypothetical protein